MLFTLLMVLYVLLAIFMIGFILVQRGTGAAAGSGFGGGASATVFGARGASSFLTKATKWLAIAFFVLTLGMATYVQRSGLVGQRTAGDDIGVMSGLEVPAAPAPPAASGDVPQLPPSAAPSTQGEDVPLAPEAAATVADGPPDTDDGNE